MWVGPKVPEAPASPEVRVALEGKVVQAVLVADSDSAAPVVAEAEGHYLVAAVAVREKAEVAAAHSAAEVGDVFSASK
jgi:hypothetical protein